MVIFKAIASSFKSAFLRLHTFRVARTICSHIDDVRDILKSSDIQKYFDHLQMKGIDESYSTDIKFQIEQLVQKRKDALSNLKALEELEDSSKEEEFLTMLNEEKFELEEYLYNLEFELFDALAPGLPNSNEVIVEITAGVGGKEAMLFASDLQKMYLNYIAFKNWSITHEESKTEDIGGLRQCTLFIEGRNVLKHLRLESGIHRVQRTPVTEKAGRIHTSTVAVAVFPRPQEIDVNLKEKDLIIETMRSSGAGGQHVNKTESAVRITHIPTGITTECQTDRSQIQNRRVARQKLVAQLYEIQRRAQSQSISKSRKSQVGTSARSDKIRTYNFPQDRITDHRITKNIHNLPVFLEGRDQLDSLIRELISYSEKERFNLFLQSLRENHILAS